jgi:hypothetical protein
MPATISVKTETPAIARAEFPQRNGISMSTLTGTPPPAPVLVPEAAIHARYVVDLPEPFDLTIGWRVNKENPIWNDERKKTIALGRETLEANRKNAFWKHPVRYIDYADKNIFRTVMIDFIPLGTKVKDVLSEILVPSGSLEQIELFPPIGDATNFMTARVVFNYEISASTFASNARQSGMKIMGQDVRVYQLLTQTWPKNLDLEEAVFERGFTRLLVLNNPSNEQIASVPKKLEWLDKWIVQYGKTHDGLPVIEFTSVAMASKALSQLLEDPDLGGIEFDFEADPCAESEPDTV